jgi:hypothetical protein
MSLDASSICSWYTGKALAAMRDFALPALVRAERDGLWPPGASRRVRAALSKQSVATRFARANDRREHADGDEGLLGDVADVRGRSYHAAEVKSWHVVFAMEFGRFQDAPRALALCGELAAHCACDAERAALETARRWAADFAPVADLVARLDAARPRPSYVFKAISPTVFANVGRAMGLAFESVRSPEVTWELVEATIGGQVVKRWIGRVLWPEGTAHGRSRFRVSEAGNSQCEACGHAIRSGLFVPLLLDGGGVPHSLWVGRDCARNLFGCVVKGDARFLR